MTGTGSAAVRALASGLVLLASLLLMPLLAQAATPPAAPAPRIGLVTMAPGEVFFERFGHDALVVLEPGAEPVSYNFGYFDPGEAGFVANFARGRMMYSLIALPLGHDLAYYRDVGRGVQLQWLDLPAAQARALADALAWQARPENARYRYDYFQANCATMVRDAIDRAMGGALHSQLAGRSAGNSWRSESVRLASPAPWMWLGFDLGLGPSADRPLSRWDEAFVPMRLADSLRQVRNSEGRPLVAEELELLPHRLPAEPAEAPRRLWPWLLAGLLAAAGLHAASRRPRLHGGLAAGFWLASGVIGTLLLAMWLGTEHRAAWANRNILLLCPLGLALLPAAWQWCRGARPGPLAFWLAAANVLSAAIALMFYGLQLQPQAHAGWIALLLPIHLVLAWQLRPGPAR